MAEGRNSAAPLLIHGGWRIRKWFILRGAGFPAHLVLDLALEDLDRRLDSLADQARNIEAERLRLLERFPSHPRLVEPIDVLDKERLALVARTARTLEPGGSKLAGIIASLERELDTMFLELEAAQDRARRRIRALASDPAFREAIAWQNRAVLEMMVDRLLKTPEDAKDSKTRERERVVSSYLQRYTTKNDCIGFFGPLAWGVASEDEAIGRVEPGPKHVKKRAVFLEHWVVDAVAQRVVAEPLLPWLVPRKNPLLGVDGQRLHLAPGQVVQLSNRDAVLLSVVTGDRMAIDLADSLSRTSPHLFADREAVLKRLTELAQKGIVLWKVEVPTVADSRPDLALRRRLEAVGDESLRKTALEPLDALEAARSALAEAAGDPERVANAVEALERAVASLGIESTRRHGETYAGRTPAYEDCVRDVDIRLGPGFFRPFERALSLMLTSARWFTHALGERYRRALHREYDAMAKERSSPIIDARSFFARVEPLFAANQYEAAPLMREVAREHCARWAQILGTEARGSEGSIERSAESIEARVLELFDAPGPGWPSARYLGPDLMIAATDLERFARGEGMAVLGELHPADNSLSPISLAFHPDREDGRAGVAHDFPRPRIAPVLTREVVTRASYQWPFEDNFHLEMGGTPSWRSRERVIAIGELVIEQIGEELVARTRDDRIRFEIIELFEIFLMAGAGHYSILESGAHTPRVTVDRLVLAREQWRFTSADLPKRTPSDVESCLRLARWARSKGLPRFAYARTPREKKPLYVDFHSPILVRLFAKMCGDAESFAVSEALPSHGQHWLADAAGNRYTAELRLIARDPRSYHQDQNSTNSDLNTRR
jgi:hypothetical protein